MTKEEIQKYLEDRNVTVLTADGFDEAFLGISCDQPPRAIYDYDKMIEILQRDMSYEDAVEYFDYNIGGSYVGPQTPLYIVRPDREEELS